MSVRRGSTDWLVRTIQTLLVIVAAGATVAPLTGCEAGPSLQAMRTQGDRALDQRDYAAAADWYEQYVARRPIEPEIRYRLGAAYLGLKQPVKAREEFLQGIEMNPIDAGRFIEGIATALVETGQRDQLFTVLRNRATTTRQPEDYLLFGKFAAIVGDPDTAEMALTEAASLDQGRSVEPQLALADFYGGVGDTEEETRRLRMVLFLDATNARANARLRELGEVPGPSIALPPTERP
ncbi:MAG: tetratricopeptide repeat protein [Planctomycetota bacterium]